MTTAQITDERAAGTDSRLISAGTIARNTIAVTVGMVAGRLATLAFYVVMARKLGPQGFGDFNFGLSVAVFVTIASLGTDFVITREVARDRGRLHEVFGNAMAIRIAFGAVGVVIAGVVGLVGHYSPAVRIVLPLLAAATLLDVVGAGYQAVFRGVEVMAPIGLSWLYERGFVAIAGSVLLLSGADLLPVTVVYFGGSVLGLAYLVLKLRRMGFRPEWRLTWQGARVMATDSLPLAAVGVSVTVLSRVDGLLLSLLKGNAAVGVYSAAYRPYEGTLIVPVLFAQAAYPALVRLGPETKPTIGFAYEKALLVLATILVPIGASFALFAPPLVRVLYGHSFSHSAFPLLVMGLVVPVWGLLLFSTYMLAAQDRQRITAIAMAIGTAANVVLNVALIPGHSYDGAAIALAASIVVIAIAMMPSVLRISGRLRPDRVLLAPAVAGAAMAFVRVAAGDTLPTLVAALCAYGVVVAAVALLAYRTDSRYVWSLMRPLLRGRAQARHGGGPGGE